MKDHFQQIVEAAVAYAKARDALNAVLADFVRAHFKEGDEHAPEHFGMQVEVPLSDIRPSIKVDGERPPKLGKVTRVVVRGLIALPLDDKQVFTTEYVTSARPAPHNTRDGVRASLKCLARRDLIRRGTEPGTWTIPDRRKLEASLLL